MIVKRISHIGLESIAACLSYITNEEKCMTPTTIGVNNLTYINSKNIARSFEYITNEQKVKKKYVSGYLCNPDTAEIEFINQIKKSLSFKNQTLSDISGNVVYHIVQSFPEGLDISDEEVHQCGVELVKMLGVYAAVIASHVHEEIKEDGEVHGKCKHNHIIFNAYIHPDFVDLSAKRLKLKYNECTTTFNELKSFNDQIAEKHSLPIIVQTSDSINESNREKYVRKQGKLWKDQVRHDIESCVKKSKSWSEYINQMHRLGYDIREGKFETYSFAIKAKEKNEKDETIKIKKIRGKTLGSNYEKEYIINQIERKKIKQKIKNKLFGNKEKTVLKSNIKENFISLDFILNTEEKLRIHCFKKKKYSKEIYKFSLDITSDRHINDYSQFITEIENYEVYNERNKIIGYISGKELFKYFEELKSVNICTRIEDEIENFGNQDIDYDYSESRIYFKCKGPKKIAIDVRERQDYYESNLLLLILDLILMLVGIDDAIQYSTHKEYVKVEVDENIQNKIDAHSFLLNNNIKTLEEFNNRFNCLINKMNLIKNSINDIDDLICQVENQIQITSSNHQLLHDLDKLKQKKETKLILLRNTKIDYRNFVKTQEVIQSLQNHQYTRKLNHKLEYEDDLNLRIEEARSFSPNQLHKENETRFCPSEIEI